MLLKIFRARGQKEFNFFVFAKMMKNNNNFRLRIISLLVNSSTSVSSILEGNSGINRLRNA